MTIVALRRKDGSSEFDCLECGQHVIRALGRQAGDALCGVCEWMRDQEFDDETKRDIRRIVYRE